MCLRRIGALSGVLVTCAGEVNKRESEALRFMPRGVTALVDAEVGGQDLLSAASIVAVSSLFIVEGEGINVLLRVLWISARASWLLLIP